MKLVTAIIKPFKLDDVRAALSDIGVFEVNEAFASVPLAWQAEFGVDEALLNPNGGAIAVGHPLGASGGRVLGTLAKVLHEGGHRWGVAAICIGVGQGLAVVLENTRADAR